MGEYTNFEDGHIFKNGVKLIRYVKNSWGNNSCKALFECPCGNVWETRVNYVANGRSNCCRKCCKNILKEIDENTYEITYIGNGKYKGTKGLVDKEFYHKINEKYDTKINWYPRKSDTTHSLHWCSNIDGNNIRMHTEIGKMFFDCDNNIYTIDHIDRNELNNSRNNLRKATKSEQCINTVKNIKNLTGYRGVTQNSKNSYSARIFFNKKEYQLGSYDNKEIAGLAVNYAHDKLNIICPRNIIDENISLTKEQINKLDFILN